MDKKKSKIITIIVIIVAIVVPFGLAGALTWKVIKNRMDKRKAEEGEDNKDDKKEK